VNRTHSSRAIVCCTTIPPARGIAPKSYRTCLLDGYLSASQIRSSTPPRSPLGVKTGKARCEHKISALPAESGHPRRHAARSAWCHKRTRGRWQRASERLKPKPGDCCMACSYGSVQCQPIQKRPARAFSDTPKRGFSCASGPWLSHCRARLRTARRARAMPWR
jgi:hypothetical protein